MSASVALQKQKLIRDLKVVQAAIAESNTRRLERLVEIENIDKTLELQKAREIELQNQFDQSEGN